MAYSKKYVEIKKDDLTGRVLPESVSQWEDAGWTAVDDGTSEPEQKLEPKTADQPVKKQAADPQPQLPLSDVVPQK